MSVDSRPNFLSALPDDAVGIITEYLDPESIINLDASSHRFHSFFTNNHYTKLARELVNKFFTLVVFALLKVPAKDKTSTLVPVLENLLKIFPELLTYRRTVKDHVGRILVNRTGYQIMLAYAADNIYPMMQEHFPRLENGEAEMKKQFSEQFPDGVIKAYPKYDIEKARTAFHKAKELIQKDTCISYDNGEDFHFLKVMDKDTRKAINEFFTLITFHKEHTIGLVNDMQLYHEGADIYYAEKEFNRFIDWPQRDAYCVFMLGGLQALSTPNILQVLLQGANRVIDQAEPLAYVTKTRFRRADVSPFVAGCQFRLGEHFFIDYYGSPVRVGRGHVFIARCFGQRSLQVWKNFVEQKQLALNNLCSNSIPQMSGLKR